MAYAVGCRLWQITQRASQDRRRHLRLLLSKTVGKRLMHSATWMQRCASYVTSMLLSSGEDGVIHLWEIARAELMRTLRIDRPYERMDIHNLTGISETQRAALIALGTIERSD